MQGALPRLRADDEELHPNRAGDTGGVAGGRSGALLRHGDVSGRFREACAGEGVQQGGA